MSGFHADRLYSGWTEKRSLRNRAHRRVKEELSFPLLGIDSDNGVEQKNGAYCP
jgi:hypothetical protein